MPKHKKNKKKSFFERIKAKRVGYSDYNYINPEETEPDDKSFLAGDDNFISVGDDDYNE